MKKNNQNSEKNKVFVVVRRGDVIGCYMHRNDAVEIVSSLLAKGEFVDLIAITVKV